MSPRKLWLRLKHLPPESEFKRQLNPHAVTSRPLASVVADLIDVQGFTAAGDKWTPYEQQLAKTRPASEVEQPEQMSQEDRFAALDAQAQRNRARDEGTE